MPRPVHFEISADDPERALHFYQAVFGWKSQKWDGPQDYWLISTGENAGHQLVALQLASYLRAKGLVDIAEGALAQHSEEVDARPVLFDRRLPHDGEYLRERQRILLRLGLVRQAEKIEVLIRQQGL